MLTVLKITHKGKTIGHEFKHERMTPFYIDWREDKPTIRPGL